MLVGHFALGFAARRIEPAVSVGTTTVAAMLADFAWIGLMLLGVEHVTFDPTVRGAANYIVSSDVSYSHSLLTNAIMAAAFGTIYFAWRHRARAALILFALVLSHWVLDVVSHAPDMPLAPGTDARFGFGLWRSVPATLVVEGGLWIAAIVLYLRSTRARGSAASAGFWIGVALLTLIWYDNIAGLSHGDRPNPIASFVVFGLFVAWAYWNESVRM